MADAIQELVQFVAEMRYEDLPDDVVALTKRFMLDNIGDTYAGTVADGCPELARLIMDWGGEPQARLLGWGTRVPAPNAVWLNSTQSRALELDDVHERGLMHASSGSVPVALAVADTLERVSGRDLLLATALGMELSCRLAMGPEVSSAISGMSFTFQCTSFGAAATAGRLMGLDQDQLHDAMGIAYSQAAGNQQTLREGALMTRVQQGLSAKSGCVAAFLARCGITGPREVLEGRFGYYNVYHGGRFDREAVVSALGERWEIRQTSTKPYPCCRFIHTTVRALTDLLEQGTIDIAGIESVQVHIDNREHFNLVCEPLAAKQRPTDVAEAQFSVPYVAAATLRNGRFALSDITEQAIADEETLALASKVIPAISPEAQTRERAGYPPAHVELRFANGERLVARSRAEAPGHPENPLAEEEHLAKFVDCMAFARQPLGEEQVSAIAAQVQSLDQADTTSALLELLH